MILQLKYFYNTKHTTQKSLIDKNRVRIYNPTHVFLTFNILLRL